MAISVEQFMAKIKRWAHNQPQLIEQALSKAALMIIGDVQQKHLTGPRMPRGVGDPKNATLAVKTNRLRGSITKRIIVEPGRIIAEIGTNVFYGRIHELGGKFHPARPFLQPSVEARQPETRSIILKTIMEGYRRGG